MQSDALTFLEGNWREFDAIHASPPCQAYSVASWAWRNMGRHYDDLLAPTREALSALSIPWVIENVPGAPLRGDYRICGCIFGLRLRRVRLFETSWGAAVSLPRCNHDPAQPALSVVGHGTPHWVRQKLGYAPSVEEYRDAMDIHWMNRGELSQAIPPAYTELVGGGLMSVVLTKRRAA